MKRQSTAFKILLFLAVSLVILFVVSIQNLWTLQNVRSIHLEKFKNPFRNILLDKDALLSQTYGDDVDGDGEDAISVNFVNSETELALKADRNDDDDAVAGSLGSDDNTASSQSLVVGNTINSNTKYLAYLPHSGFSNQVGELENAIMLAKLSNRTLIIPPLYIGWQDVPWHPFDDLMQSVRIAESLILGDQTSPPEYVNIDTYNQMKHKFNSNSNLRKKAVLPADLLFNLDFVESSVSAYEFVQNIQTSGPLYAEDILLIKEQAKYHYRYLFGLDQVNDSEIKMQGLSVDGLHKNFSAGASEQAQLPTQFQQYQNKFQHIVNWQESDHKLVVIGSTFGFNRLLLLGDDAALNATMAEVRRSLTLQNKNLGSIVDSLISQMPFDKNDFWISVHLRSGDGSFKNRVGTSVQSIIAAIQKNKCPEDTPAQSLSSQCIKTPVNIFVATDLSDPLQLQPLADCPDIQTLVTLNDFDLDLFAEILHTLSDERSTSYMESLSPLIDYLHGHNLDEDEQLSLQSFSPEDTARSNPILNSIWYPFIDQLIAARSHGFIGTRGSTFTNLIERMHQAFRQEDAWTIDKV
ncbi:hypothetical protein MP228_008968 [Amoeboaphelidium protococcarum]|nr:hypothetical protein MP228_008968 [Amoeboaphelidium protococcarum]